MFCGDDQSEVDDFLSCKIFVCIIISFLRKLEVPFFLKKSKVIRNYFQQYQIAIEINILSFGILLDVIYAITYISGSHRHP